MDNLIWNEAAFIERGIRLAENQPKEKVFSLLFKDLMEDFKRAGGSLPSVSDEDKPDHEEEFIEAFVDFLTKQDWELDDDMKGYKNNAVVDFLPLDTWMREWMRTRLSGEKSS